MEGFISSPIKPSKGSSPQPSPLLSSLSIPLLFGFMSCFGLKKPLHPSKKAWSRLAASVQIKLHKLRRSKPIAAILPGHHLVRRKHHKGFHTRKLSHHRRFAPVYVDELFSPKAVAVHVEPWGEEEKKAKAEKIAGKSVIAGPSTSQVVGDMGEVDMRAEMFIAKFKEEMRLQRQLSFGEYQEMLARGV